MRIALSLVLVCVALAACGQKDPASKVYDQLPASNPHLAPASSAPNADEAQAQIFNSIKSKRIKE